MACPHGSGDPKACSQCVGATARIVSRDADGMMRIDGVLLVDDDGRPRRFQPKTAGPAGPPRRMGRPSRAVMELRRREAMENGDELGGEDLD